MSEKKGWTQSIEPTTSFHKIGATVRPSPPTANVGDCIATSSRIDWASFLFLFIFYFSLCGSQDIWRGKFVDVVLTRCARRSNVAYVVEEKSLTLTVKSLWDIFNDCETFKTWAKYKNLIIEIENPKTKLNFFKKRTKGVSTVFGMAGTRLMLTLFRLFQESCKINKPKRLFRGSHSDAWVSFW